MLRKNVDAFSEVINWCRDNISDIKNVKNEPYIRQPVWYSDTWSVRLLSSTAASGAMTFYIRADFDNESDATMFKLRWV